MTKHFTLAFTILWTTFSVAQNIQEVQAYSKLGGTRIIALLDNQGSSYYTEDDGWQDIPVGDFPEGEIKFLDVYHKRFETRLMIVSGDNSIWWSNDEKWEKVTDNGLPQGYNITAIEPYSKMDNRGNSMNTRILVTLEDNSLWWFAADYDEWEQVIDDGLPEDAKIETVRTYQKFGMFGGTSTRYIALMSDNSIWWYAQDADEWESFEDENYPTDLEIVHLEAYMKFKAMGMPDGRLVAVMSDQSFWWTSAKNPYWEQLEIEGLPEGYQVKQLVSYQKFSGLSNDTRLLVLLEDNTLWWYADGDDFTQIKTADLLKN